MTFRAVIQEGTKDSLIMLRERRPWNRNGLTDARMRVVRQYDCDRPFICFGFLINYKLPSDVWRDNTNVFSVK